MSTVPDMITVLSQEISLEKRKVYNFIVMGDDSVDFGRFLMYADVN